MRINEWDARKERLRNAGAVHETDNVIQWDLGRVSYGVFFSAAADLAAGLGAAFGAQNSGLAMIVSGLT